MQGRRHKDALRNTFMGMILDIRTRDCYLHSSRQHAFLGALVGVIHMAPAFFRLVDFAGLRSS